MMLNGELADIGDLGVIELNSGRTLAACRCIRVSRAVDEIQLYNAEIAMSANSPFSIISTTPSAGARSRTSGRADPEPCPQRHAGIRLGITEWFELGLYIPWAIDSEGRFLSNAAKLRTLFVTPNATRRISSMASISSTTIRRRGSRDPLRHGDPADHRLAQPAVGIIVNPIVDLGFGSRGDIDSCRPRGSLAR